MKIGLGIGLGYSKESGGAIIPPANTVAPVISGTAVVGQVLTSTTGTWTGTAPITYSYQWKRGATNIGTNSSSYTLVSADAGNTSNITCVVTATNAGGSANATSNTIAQILTVRTNSFLTASAITDATIRGGLNTFDIGLIANSLDTKMKAVYPFVGGTASTHKFNFMNSADTDAAFRILFNGTVTHTSNGVQGNAINGFLDTRLNTSTNLTKTSAHLSLYIRNNPAVPAGRYDMGNASNAGLTTDPTYLIARYNTGIAAFGLADSSYATSAASTNSIGFWNGATNGSSAQVLYRNGTSYATGTAGAGAFANNNLYISGANANGTLAFPTDREYAFSSIGDGLSGAEASTLYTLVQGLQTTLGRQVGVPIVSDSDAQAFLNAAEITSTTEANAINTLVIGMKAQGLWTKMKAVYPMVGGTASAHKFNLKDPRDLDAAYRLIFIGGWGHSSLGALPNGVNTYAETKLVPSIRLNTNDHAIFFYTNTNNGPIAVDPLDMGSIENINSRIFLYSRLDAGFAGAADGNFIQAPYTAPLGCFALVTKQSATVTSLFKNATKIGTVNSGGTPPPLYDLIFGNVRITGTPYGAGWSTNRFAMVGISDGLSDADSVNLYNLTQAFQTSLGRSV